ncbi:hypothetical protein Bp8pC_071 [Bacillus phage Bp8p-C]|uniref:Uncharacterized protein n=2 Tax=Agatevirus Bp8pC TaxID=1910937 RepID=A0A0A0PLI6_9CAUD|nr:hypothetical protein AXJ20_gp071 [Bacillus phage Bp8p-C]YP_009784372.1 hypothetical protein QLX39_gp071 [Bacillus phage Bp8p-T]AHJ87502.1 hypothetical protein Bp8pC_071 [Bacillus phage Bp8p-C]AHJ87713.1 hypothetical protein Bp8pT_071 [Bacillus phage Bp8p-T]
MECNNSYCMWNYNGQCCPESKEAIDNATPNELDCPSSLRKDLQSNMYKAVDEINDMLVRRNHKEIAAVHKFVSDQRKN